MFCFVFPEVLKLYILEKLELSLLESSLSSLFPYFSPEKKKMHWKEQPQEYVFSLRVFICSAKWAGCFLPASPLFHALLCTLCRRGSAAQRLLCDWCFAPAELCRLLLVQVPCSFEFCPHTSLASQRVLNLCQQNACYLRLINPYPAASRFFLIFVTQELFAMRSKAPPTVHFAPVACCKIICFFSGIWIFFRISVWHWVRGYCVCLACNW